MSTEIEVWSGNALDKFRESTITSPGEYREVKKIARGAKVMMKGAEDAMKSEITQAHELHKALVAKRKEVTEPLKEVLDVAGRILGEWDAKLIAEERAEHARLGEIARRERVAEAKVAAVQLAASGETEAAASAMAHADNLPAPVVEAPRLREANDGVVTRTTYEIEVTNEATVPAKYKVVDIKAIRAAVNEAKGDIKIKGVTITPVTKTHVQA